MCMCYYVFCLYAQLSACSNQNSAEKSAVEVWPDTTDTLLFEPVFSSLVKVVDGSVVHVGRFYFVRGGGHPHPGCPRDGNKRARGTGPAPKSILIIC